MLYVTANSSHHKEWQSYLFEDLARVERERVTGHANLLVCMLQFDLTMFIQGHIAISIAHHRVLYDAVLPGRDCNHLLWSVHHSVAKSLLGLL